MKYIPLRAGPQFKSADIIRMVVRNNDKGMDLEEVRRRVRILKALDKAASTHVLLEDADHAVLVKVLKGFQGFAVADEEMLDIIDEVIGAKEPPAILAAAAE